MSLRAESQPKNAPTTFVISLSPKPCVFRFSLLKNGDFRVGILPQFEEVLERLLRLHSIARKYGGSRDAQMRRVNRTVPQ